MQGTVDGIRQGQAMQGSFTPDSISERRLWLAVVMQAVEEWRNGTLRNRRKAQEFIFDNSHDFEMVCANAGLDAENLRSRLLKIGRKIEAQGPWSYRLASVAA
jgi:hypothetical protein